MKLISKCERQFVSNCIIKRQKRVDGREFNQGRTLEIVFGKERGCCMVLQGNTRVLVQVSCDISEPKKSTPTEGIIHVNYELSAMASPDAKSIGRSSEEFIEAQRSLERCIRDSKCIDLESLCIVTASKVWTIRVDIHGLNDDGNLTECASIAAISALAHFRRPEVTVTGTDVTVHSIEEKEPVALNLHHMPITISLALFDGGKHILVDPTEIEEKVCDGCYVMGMNAHQEICFVHRRGVLILKEEVVRRCEDVALKRAQELTQIIRTALDDDAYKRATNAPIGFIHLIQTGTILGAKRRMAEINLDDVRNMPPEENDVENIEHMETNNVDNDQLESSEDEKEITNDTSKMRSKAKERALHILQETEATVFEGGRSKWGDESDDETSEEEEEGVDEEVPETKPDVSAIKEEEEDSEEEAVFINKEQLDRKSSDKRGWFIKDPFA